VGGTLSDCACVHVSDVYIRFPDDSLKRLDIAIFYQEPDEQTTVITMIPEAVIEIVSPGYEVKDLSVGVPFYLGMRSHDLVIYLPNNLK
jgi:hypothetical protein